MNVRERLAESEGWYRIKIFFHSMLISKTRLNGFFDQSASLSFYIIMATFPALIAVLSLVILFPVEDLETILMMVFNNYFPKEINDFITGQISRVNKDLIPEISLTSIIVSLVLAALGFNSLIKVIHKAYRTKDESDVVHKVARAFFITFTGGLFFIISVAFLTFISDLLLNEAGKDEAQGYIRLIIMISKYLVFGHLVIFFTSLLYSVARTKNHMFIFYLPGSVLTAIFITVGTTVFEIYVKQFGTHAFIYGSLAAPFIYFNWIYLLSCCLIFGAYSNIEYENYCLEKIKKEKINYFYSKKSKYFVVSLASVVGVLFLASSALSFVGERYINFVLDNNLESYKGSIKSFEIRLWSGTYTIKGLRLQKPSFKDKPLINLGIVKGKINWKSIWSEKYSLNLQIEGGGINIVETDKSDQYGYKEESNESWLKVVDTIVPISINNLIINKVSLSFWVKDNSGWVSNTLDLNKFEVENILDPQGYKSHLSPIKLRGSYNEISNLNIKGGINFKDSRYPFDLALVLKKFDLKSLNKMLLKYVPLDISSGEIEIYSNLKGNLENADGNAKVFVNNLKIISPDQEYKSTKHFLVEMVVGFLNWLVDISAKNDLATEFPIKIRNGSVEFSALNAFINSLGTEQQEIKKNTNHISK